MEVPRNLSVPTAERNSALGSLSLVSSPNSLWADSGDRWLKKKKKKSLLCTCSFTTTWFNLSWTTPACASAHCWTTPASQNAPRKWVVLLNVPQLLYFSTDLFQIVCVCRLHNRQLHIVKKTVLLWKQTNCHLWKGGFDCINLTVKFWYRSCSDSWHNQEKKHLWSWKSSVDNSHLYSHIIIHEVYAWGEVSRNQDKKQVLGVQAKAQRTKSLHILAISAHPSHAFNLTTFCHLAP